MTDFGDVDALAAGWPERGGQPGMAYGIVLAVFGAATRRWLAGVSSPAQARFEIRAGCRLLDLPDQAVCEDVALAGSAG